jgi:hypothetical protein
VFGDRDPASPDPLLGTYHRLDPGGASGVPSTQRLIGGMDETIILEPVLSPSASQEVLPVLQVRELELRPARI